MFEIDKASVIEEEILSLSKNFFIVEYFFNFQFDYEYSIFLENQSEFLFKLGKKENAINKIKEARHIIWSKLGKINFFINNQSFSDKKYTDGLEIDKELKQLINDREASVVTVVTGKKAEPVKKKDEIKVEISQINYNSLINYQEINRNKDSIFDKISTEVNNSDEGSNLYFRFTDNLCRVDLKYCLYLLNILNSDLNMIESVIKDVETLSNKLLYPHNSTFILINYIQGKLYKLMFTNNYNQFIEEKMLLIIAKNKIEVIKPEILQKLSNYYNERCINIWIPLLIKSKDFYEKSIKLMKTEFYSIEFGINLYDIMIDLSDVCLLLAENRPSLNPKFADFNQIVNKISSICNKHKFYDKENDDLPHIGDETLEESIKNERITWNNDKIKDEKLKIKNYLK